MPTQNYRILLGFSKGTADNLGNLALDVFDALTGNAAFPDPTVPLTVLTTQQLAFNAARIEARKGGRDRTRTKNLAQEALADTLVRNALYCQGKARQDLDTLLSSGYRVASTNRVSAPLSTPTILDLLNDVSGQLTVRGQGVLNGRNYRVQVSKDNGATWVDAGTFNGARRMMLTGLTSGTVYLVRFAALGGSTGQSPWSNPMGKMAT
jgi:hypothetical protein